MNNRIIQSNISYTFQEMIRHETLMRSINSVSWYDYSPVLVSNDSYLIHFKPYLIIYNFSKLIQSSV